MPIKKSELYNSLWKSCDELRGGMDASQYKDYVLVMLFIKYVSDKYSGKPDALIEIPEGASFRDMVKIKGKSDIGDKVNKIIGKLADANELKGVITVADFNDSDKLGKGKAMVDRLSNLIAIFENPALDFSSNRAESDDILGDAYEYLMRHFATQSGKSKGQFYTPAEVSRVMAKVIGIKDAKNPSETVYDPTCGSGSLLLKAADETTKGITIYGQEIDNATRALAVMNMWIHGNPIADIRQGDTIALPLFKDEKTGKLKTFDYVVANPPFSNKSWSNGIDQYNDFFERFEDYGIPPLKNGDYAFLLHILKSLKSKGKGACILPLGVLFRGNIELEIRKNIIKRGYIKSIIKLPANLFYGTGIPACIVILDKENAETRKEVFMIDAGNGFTKDGNKNRLREQDIRKIVDVFNNKLEIKGYSRLVPISEISNSENQHNLNIPLYIEKIEIEDVQNIEAHLNGGIPESDINNLKDYWKVFPSLKETLFNNELQSNFLQLKIKRKEIKSIILNLPDFISYEKIFQNKIDSWKESVYNQLNQIDLGIKPKLLIQEISEKILTTFNQFSLINKYDIYQHLMNYWISTMQDDMHEISTNGWKTSNDINIISKNKSITFDKLVGRLIPPLLIANIYFDNMISSIYRSEQEKESIIAKMEELKEDYGNEEGALYELIDKKGKISKKKITDYIKEINSNIYDENEYSVLLQFKKLKEKESDHNKIIKKKWENLAIFVIDKYKQMSKEDIKNVVINHKWLGEIENKVKIELDNLCIKLAKRIIELAERYETTLLQLTKEVRNFEQKFIKYLEDMGFEYNEL